MSKEIHTIGDLVGGIFDGIDFLFKMIFWMGIATIIGCIGFGIHDYLSDRHFSDHCHIQEGTVTKLPKGDLICVSKDGKLLK